MVEESREAFGAAFEGGDGGYFTRHNDAETDTTIQTGFPFLYLIWHSK
jgi:hypothetical protein